MFNEISFYGKSNERHKKYKQRTLSELIFCLVMWLTYNQMNVTLNFFCDMKSGSGDGK